MIRSRKSSNLRCFIKVNCNVGIMKNRESARTNYGYEFLIKMTFIWERDEDNEHFSKCHFLGKKKNFDGKIAVLKLVDFVRCSH